MLRQLKTRWAGPSRPRSWAGSLAFSAGLALVAAGAVLADDVKDGGSPTAVRTGAPEPSPAEMRLKTDVTFMADDEREGRAPGTPGIEAAARYIAGVFQTAGLKPAAGADGFFQPFSISGRPVLAGDQELAFTGPDGNVTSGKVNDDFRPLAIGQSAKFEAMPVVFAGFGITAKDPDAHFDYDDYADLDVKGKVVLLLRREPRPADRANPFHGDENTPYATFQHKATNAFQHGAAGVLLVNDLGTLDGGSDQLLALHAAGNDAISGIPVVMLTRQFGERLLKAARAPSLAELEQAINERMKPRSSELKGVTLAARIAIKHEGIETRNVVGVLEGAGPKADETIVIGGHYDHLGHGGVTSGSLAIFSRDIHNGADDNASGTAMVLELARRLAARRDPLPRRVVFMTFSGEEKGLLGSRFYVEHPLYPLKSTVMMINCDMVGRLNGKSELTMIGTGTTAGINTMVVSLGEWAGLKIKTVSGMTDGFGGSDHEPFYAKDVPVLFAFTGLHGDYHRPSDDSERINFAGMARIADYLELIALETIRRPDRPALVKVQTAQPPPTMRRPGATLGIVPEYGREATDGLKLAGVRPGGAADKAGLKEGDLIVKLGGKQISTINDYMETMGRYHGGEEIEVVVERDGRQVPLRVTVEGSARQRSNPHN